MKCCSCGKEVQRHQEKFINKYGVWGPKCEDCKKIERRAKEYIKKQGDRIKLLYKTDPEFRRKVIETARETSRKRYADPEVRRKIIENACERYWERRKPSKITEEEMRLLELMNSYPVVVPGNIGTSQPSTNLKIVEVDGKRRVKGAVWLGQLHKRRDKIA